MDTVQEAPECYCGRLLKRQPLPSDVADVAGRDAIWLHDDGEILCYPDARNQEDRKACAEPVAGEGR